MATTITANGINFPDGSAGSPSIGGTDTNTGLFTGSDIVGFATGGSERLRIDASGNVNIANDSGKLQLGTSADLQIYHNGTHSYIKDAGTGNLILQTSKLNINNADGTEGLIHATENGKVELYYDNSVKFETTSSGVSVTGGVTASGASTFNEDVTFTGTNANIQFDKTADAIEFLDNAEARFGTGDDLKIYHNGTHSYITNATNDLTLECTTNDAALTLKANTIYIKDESNQYFLKGIENTGSVELYYGNSKKFETTSAGATFSGSVLINNSSGVNVYGSISMTETSTYGWVKSFSGKGLYLVPTSNGVYLDSGNTSWNSGSDERTKTGLTPITDALTKIEGCRSVIGRYKTDEETTERSFLIAQDFQTHFPVAVGKNKTLPDDENLSLRYQDVIPLLLAGIKELSAEAKTLKTKVTTLEAK